jgi:hypothetical protein
MHLLAPSIAAALFVVTGVSGTAAPTEPAARDLSRPVVGAVLSGLRSSDPRAVAWSARWAGASRLVEAVPALVERFRAPGTADDTEAFLVRAAVLDALVRIDAPIPCAPLVPQGTGLLTDGVVVLALRSPRRNLRAIREMFDRAPPAGPAWLALGNELERQDAPGFVAKVLSDVRFRLRVRVWTRVVPWRDPGGSVPG